MKFRVPWQVKGMRPEVRQAAREAARRSGMPLKAWVDHAIMESALDEGVDPEALADAESGVNERLDELTRQLERLARVRSAEASAPTPTPTGGDHAQLGQAIARLDARLEQLIDEGRNATSALERRVSAVDQTIAALHRVPPQAHTMMPPAPLPPQPGAAGAFSPVAWPSGVDQAVAEIEARRRVLDGEAAGFSSIPVTSSPPVVPTPAPQSSAAPPWYHPPAPAPDLSGLQSQLEAITSRLETLRGPSDLDGTFAALRSDLAEIARKLTDAMPRQALESLESEVRRLAERVDASRESGADPAQIGGIERALTDVRDTLHGLTPAENLGGLERTVRGLAEKIDFIASTQHDPAALQHLEAAIASLRGITTHVASDDALARLADEVRGLTERIDQLTVGATIAGGGTGSDALAALEQRIALLSEQLDARHRRGEDVPVQVDEIVKSLTDKLERVQLSRGDHMALGHLENRIAKLVERLDASDARLGQLESIERGLVDLLVHIEDLRALNGGSRAADGSIAAPGVASGMQRELSELKDRERRTEDTLEAVHGTLGHVVERLAMIETGLRDHSAEPAPAALKPVPVPVAAVAAAPAAAMAVSPAIKAPAPAPARAQAAATAPAVAAVAPVKAEPIRAVAEPVDPIGIAPAVAPASRPAPSPHVAPRRPIDPTLPPDHPLEPGSGGRATPGSAAERIAASEAALGPAKPPVIPDPGGKSDFIAAARRAAQAAAAADTVEAPAPRAAAVASGAESGTLTSRIAKRVRALFVGAAALAITLGAVHVGWRYFVDTAAETAATDADRPLTTATGRQPDAPAAAPTLPPPPSEPNKVLPPSGMLAPTEAAPGAPAAGMLPLGQPPATQPPTRTGPTKANADVTGSVPLPPVHPSPNHQTPAATPRASITALPALPAAPAVASGTDDLPDAIGSRALRAAAAKGDIGAAYEVALRFADGRGVPQNYEESARWLERAAKGGLAAAQFRLGSLYDKGRGLKKDLNEARRLYLAAAGQGNAKAMHNLAVLYAEGIDGKPDYGNATQWFRKAAERGITDSQYNLAILYARGIGVERNLAESYKWFALAARGGDRDSEHKLEEVAKRLDAQSLMAAKLAVQTWTPTPQPPEATDVKAPPGGWDHPTAHAPSRPRSGAVQRARVRAAQNAASD